MRLRLAAIVVPIVALAGCGGAGLAEHVSVVPTPVKLVHHHGIHRIKHVVLIMQENRSFDSYFGTFPGADGLPAKDGRFSVCVPDPRARNVPAPVPRLRQVNGGAQHNADSSRADIGRRADGRLRPDGGAPGGRGCGLTASICESSAPPDVMGYHDAREIPNYWRWAREFTLQDHMFEPAASWSLPQHLYMVSGWSAHCTRGGDPIELRERRSSSAGSRPARSATAAAQAEEGDARALQPVARCLVHHGIRREPYGLDLRQPHEPDALALCRQLAPPGEAGALTQYGNYAWTDMTYLFHRRA